MNSLAFQTRRATLDGGKVSPLQGSSLVELVVAAAVIMVGVLAFTRALTESLELGEQKRHKALGTAAPHEVVEALEAAHHHQVFALYNEDPDDDPDGTGTAPGARFVAEGLEALAADAGKQGRIFFPVDANNPDELREDLIDSKLRVPLDLNLDGSVDGSDHAGDYRLLPVLVRVTWLDGRAERELEVATILGDR